jgi:putative (di)nucleoside polyphosphate hydrolase
MKKIKKLPLRKNVCILLFNTEGKLFLGERAGVPGEWQFPQGGAEKGYSLAENVAKELCEELGLLPKHFKIIKQLRAVHEYEWDTPPDYAKGKYRGQSQTFWLVEFLGKDTDIDINANKPEFMNYQWCTSHQVKTKAHSKRQPGYMLPLREFEDYLLLIDTGLV